MQKADLAQARGIDGTGTRVGVLSDSYASVAAHPNAADDVASLATCRAGWWSCPVRIWRPATGKTKGARCCSWCTTWRRAPDSGFATAFTGEVQFSNNDILSLRRSFHADVIVDDVVYFDEPMFSDGLLAQTVDKVVSEGAAYFSSAGNNGLEAYQASYDPISVAGARQLVAQGKENIDIDSLAAHGLPAQSFHKFRNRDGSESFTCSGSHLVLRRRRRLPVGRAVRSRQGEDRLQHLRVRRGWSFHRSIERSGIRRLLHERRQHRDRSAVGVDGGESRDLPDRHRQSE